MSQIDIHSKNNIGRTGLWMAAADTDNPEMIKLLVAHGADVNAADNYGIHPLTVATLRNHTAVAKELEVLNANENFSHPYIYFTQRFRNDLERAKWEFPNDLGKITKAISNVNPPDRLLFFINLFLCSFQPNCFEALDLKIPKLEGMGFGTEFVPVKMLAAVQITDLHKGLTKQAEIQAIIKFWHDTLLPALSISSEALFRYILAQENQAPTDAITHTFFKLIEEVVKSPNVLNI